ncbi:Zinc finger CCHC domain-containing protein 13 [Bienertia sinuspersici]
MGTFVEFDSSDSFGYKKYMRFGVDFKYEKLPDFCYICGFFGHVAKNFMNYDEEIAENLYPYGSWLHKAERQGNEAINSLGGMVKMVTKVEEFPLLTVYHLNVGDSDHLPIKMEEYKGNKKERRKGMGFKCEDFWLASGDCAGVVEEAWQVEKGGDEVGVLKFGDIPKKIKVKKERLVHLASCPPTIECCTEYRSIMKEMDDLLLKEEIYLRQRARVQYF